MGMSLDDAPTVVSCFLRALAEVDVVEFDKKTSYKEMLRILRRSGALSRRSFDSLSLYLGASQ
jgi:hypothetical protein